MGGRYAGDKTVPAPMHRFDEARRARVVSQSLTDPTDRDRQRRRFHVGLGPDGFEQLFLGNQAGGVLGEITQNLETLWREVDRFSVTQQLLGAQVEATASKLQSQGRDQHRRIRGRTSRIVPNARRETPTGR
ncbi:MAG: hypothetical protein WD733_24800 [Bryobacterales bacterium]